MKYFDLASDSKVWIYQADRVLSSTEINWIEEQLQQFVGQWAAHGAKLKAQGKVIGQYHVVIAVDQNFANASGCSIDASVRFIKTIGQELEINFFNRMKLLVEKDGEQQLVPFSSIKEYPESMVYNNLVDRLDVFEKSWVTKVAESPFV